MATQNINNMSRTWSSGSTTYTAIKMNVTDAASAAASKLFDLQVGGVTKFDVRKDGVLGIKAMMLAPKGSDAASAATLTLGVDGNYFDVTGTTAITSIASVGVGTRILLQFDDALVLTHHATDLILPGAANITTAAGDHAEFVEYASGDWRCVSYTKASGQGITFSPFTPAEDDRIINGAFEIAQRGTSTSSDGYGGPDRWINALSGGTVTHEQVALTVGDTLGSNTARYISRQAVSGQSAASNYAIRTQRIEGVHSYAGQTITFLGWARRVAGAGNMVVEGVQLFGTGGSPSSAVNGIDPTTITLSTLWTPFAATMDVPSIAGKALGSNGDDCFVPHFWISGGSDWNARTNSLGIQTITVDLGGIHIRKGIVPVEAAAFYTPPSIQKTQSDCERYFEKTEISLIGAAGAGEFIGSHMLFGTKKRAIPAVNQLTPTENVNFASTTMAPISQSGFRYYGTTTASGNAYITRVVEFNAEL